MRRAHIAVPVLAATLSTVAARADAPNPVTQRPCFGAAARDPLLRCADRSLRLTVFPAPEDAVLEPNSPCLPMGRSGLLYPCRFALGRTASGDASETIVLVGDSHASHWRAAVQVLADRKRRPAISIARSRCPFIDATVVMAAEDRRGCLGWNEEVKAWLQRHPEVSTLFVSHRSTARFVPIRGKDNFETQVVGHMSLWRSLPNTIKDIVVIRDTPRGSAASTLCVQRAFAARRAAGPRCARSRERALRADPAVAAAQRMHSRRVHAIDLSRFFCTARRCFPVVGGALVYKDSDHITAVFARTLGRYLARAYDVSLRAGGAAGPLDGLAADERLAAECLISERLAASQAGGWNNVSPASRARADACRIVLERRAAELKALGLSAEHNRKRRYAVIQSVLET